MNDLNDKIYKTLEALVRLRFEFSVSYDIEADDYLNKLDTIDHCIKTIGGLQEGLNND